MLEEEEEKEEEKEEERLVAGQEEQGDGQGGRTESASKVSTTKLKEQRVRR